LTENVETTQQTHRYKMVGFVGVLCLIGILFFASMLVHRLWISNYFSHKAAEAARNELLTSWPRLPESTPNVVLAPVSIPPDQTIRIETPSAGKAFAFLYVPRLSNDVWATPIFEGVSSSELDRGIGHNPGSALPGVEGNFSLFGHRTSRGQPFSNIQLLEVGDEVIVETKNFWFVYRLRTDLIVKPDQVWVTNNDRLDALNIDQLNPYKVITLITCEPRYSTAKRWVWWGVLSAIYPHDSPPQVLEKPLP
jgi:LPXTG-site transpeptidase (sortase) family protein